MSSTSTSTSGSGSSPDKLTIDIRPLLEDVSQVMTKHITSILSGVVGEYTVYKETHETIMGLPCVRKLQDRISDLENQLNGGDPASSASASASAPPTEISELQSAIVDLNRYIQVLETRMNVNNVVSSQQVPEEAIRLEVHENDDASSDANEPDVIIPQSVHTNRIIDTSVVTHDETEATDEEDAEEEIEVSEIKIKGVTYFTTSAQNGIIYACVDDDVGDEVGVFKNGVALFKSKTAKK